MHEACAMDSTALTMNLVALDTSSIPGPSTVASCNPKPKASEIRAV